jgi:hypothetical protein
VCAHVLYAQLAHCKARLVDARGLCARAQDIGLDGHVVGVGYPLDLVEEAASVSTELATMRRAETY